MSSLSNEHFHLVYDNIIDEMNKGNENEGVHTRFPITPFDDEHTNPFADAVSLGRNQLKDFENIGKLENSMCDDYKSNQDDSVRSWFTSNKLQLNVSSFRSCSSGRSPILSLQNVELDYDPLSYSNTDVINPDISNNATHTLQDSTVLNKEVPSLINKIKDTHLNDRENEGLSELSKSVTSDTIQIPQDESSKQNNKVIYSIFVGDPHIIGDIASAHTVYKVTTCITSNTSNLSEFIVHRRYRDFLWLYNSLHSNNPGVIAPSPPEKQAENFIEFRRHAFERMLRKIVAHPILQNDPCLKIRVKEKIPLYESKGFISSIGEAFTRGAFSGKFVEQDNWFSEQKQIFDLLDIQFKGMSKTIDAVVKQKKDLAQATGELGHVLSNLSIVELDKTLSFTLSSFSDLLVRIKEFYERQAQQDILILGCMVDEYIRLIGSAKYAFSLRQKAYLNWQVAEFNLSKCKFEKVKSRAKSHQNYMYESSTKISNAEKRCQQLRNNFDSISNVLKEEIERFEIEKIEDFRGSVETFLESVIEAQKELIELWETYLAGLEKNIVFSD
ncbi:hypothetical protein PCANB_001191 [Pneumocystis canis]|nr:hypothetical protein PCANB_001191 [Pneumocystis canis]